MIAFIESIKKSYTVILFLILGLWLVGCTTTQAPESTDVAPPAAQTAVPLPPTQMPTTSAEEPAVEDSAATLATFVAQLQQAVSDHNYEQMAAAMNDPFAIGGWRSEWRIQAPQPAIDEFQTQYLPMSAAVQFNELSLTEIAALLDGQPPAAMLGPTVNVAAVIHSTGWGQTGADEAILFVADAGDGRYTWDAFLYTFGTFAQPITFTPAPAGLIYRTPENGLWQIVTDSPPRQLTERNDTIVTPDGRYAAYIDENKNLWLIDTADGNQRQLTQELLLSGFFLWGDADTILLGVWMNMDEAEGPNNGHIATLDINSGDLQILDEQRLSSSRPALSPDGQTVAFEVFAAGPDDALTGRLYHPDSGLQNVDPALFAGAAELTQGTLFNPAWSPDGRQLAWLSATGERFAVHLFDLTQQSVMEIHHWDPARFGALVPSPVWGPDGQWLALEVWANGPDGSGLWLLAADGSSRQRIDAQGGDPYWMDANQIIYARYDENRNGVTQVYNLTSGTQSILALPQEWSIVVAMAGAAGSDIPVADTEVAFVLALQDVTMYNGPAETYEVIGGIADGQTARVTGVSQDGAWWRVICPDDTIGNCWVTADPAFTNPSN